MSKYIPDLNTAQGRWQHQLVQTSEIPYANHDHLRKIWHNPLNRDSLRLSKMGWEWATTCTTFKAYHFKLDGPMTNKMLLQLDHFFNSPYYIVNRINIYMFGEQDAIMMQLHGSNLSVYLDNLNQNN